MNIPKIIPAGGGERAQYLLHNYNDNTIRFVFNYPGIIDAEILALATKAVIESVDVLHGTFFSDNIMAYWHINDMEDVDENNYFHYVETTGNPAVTANSLSLLPIYPEDKVQMLVTLVQNSESSSVIICLSHLVVDGGDGKYLIKKLVEAYNNIIRNGFAGDLNIKNGNRAPEKVYETVERKDAKGLFTSPISTVPTAYPYTTTESGHARIVKEIISAETMSSARAKAKNIGATVNDLLITACYHAYASMETIDASQPMSVSSMMDLRHHCVTGESEGLCNMSGALPTTLENGVSGTFSETLALVTEQTRKAKENPLAGLEGMPIMHGLTRTMPIGIMLNLIGKIYGNPSIGLTNLGNLKCSEYELNGLTPNSGIFGGPLKKKPGMQISVISFDGECVLSVVGIYTKEDADLLQSTLNTMKIEIEQYILEK